MRKTCLNMVYQMAMSDERVVFIGSDLGHGTLDEYRRDMSDRYFMEGISEANVIGMAAGMALEGFVPYVNTIASFLVRRSYEQVAVDLCLHKLPVRLIGNGGGLVYAPLGPTHQTVEDIASMRALPGMCVICPADATEMQRIMPQTLDWPGPIYIRLAKGWDPIVTPEDQEFVIGKTYRLSDGDDAAVFTTGVMLQIALEAAGLLASKGIGVRVVHVPTVKPLDVEAIVRNLSKVRAAVSIEEHSIVGGLGGALAEVIAEGYFSDLKFKRLGLRDIFAERYGTQNELWNYYGLTSDAIVSSLCDLLNIRNNKEYAL